MTPHKPPELVREKRSNSNSRGSPSSSSRTLRYCRYPCVGTKEGSGRPGSAVTTTARASVAAATRRGARGPGSGTHDRYAAISRLRTFALRCRFRYQVPPPGPVSIHTRLPVRTQGTSLVCAIRPMVRSANTRSRYSSSTSPTGGPARSRVRSTPSGPYSTASPGCWKCTAGGRAGAISVQTSPAVRHHRVGQGVQRVPVHAVAPVRLRDPGPPRPAVYLEEDAESGAGSGRWAVVDGDGRGHVLRLDGYARFLAGLPDDGFDHLLVGVEVSGREVPQARRVHHSCTAGQQYLGVALTVAAREQVAGMACTVAVRSPRWGRSSSSAVRSMSWSWSTRSRRAVGGTTGSTDRATWPVPAPRSSSRGASAPAVS